MFRNKKLIIGALVFLIIACAAVIIIANQKSSRPNEGTLSSPTATNSSNDGSSSDNDPNSTSSNASIPSDTDFKNTIVADTPYLKDSQTGQPTFSIVSQTTPQPKWYILKLRLNTVNTSDATIVLEDQGGKSGLRVVLGPGTSFSPEMTSGLPNKVREALASE